MMATTTKKTRKKKTTSATATNKKKTTAERPATAKTKATVAATPKTPEAPKVPGVRPMRTRPYLAGLIIARHGIAAGVTNAMVEELDEAYGKPNPTESTWCLKNAWHSARGYTGVAENATE